MLDCYSLNCSSQLTVGVSNCGKNDLVNLYRECTSHLIKLSLYKQESLPFQNGILRRSQDSNEF